jgi:biotin-(acetyl-CoA carboxylase) ligase
MVTADKLKSDIEAACPGIPVRAFDVVLSLEREAQRALSSGEEGPLLFSALQTGKEGPSNGVKAHVSLLLGPKGASLHPLTVAVMAAAACAMAIERLTPAQVEIGWPADVLLQGKPVARIAVDAPVCDGGFTAMATIAVNICEGENAGGLEASLNAPYLAPGRLAGEIAREVFGFVQEGTREYMEFYRDRSTALEREVSYFADGENRSGRVMGVDDDGALIVLNKHGAPDRLEDPALPLRFA